MTSVNTEVAASNIQGLGLFAKRDFAKGEMVYQYPQGKLVTPAEIASLSTEEQQHLDRVAENQFEVIQPPACYVNHSCNPNIVERDHGGYAIRDIAASEELTVDYCLAESFGDIFVCRCGTPGCRGEVK